MSHTTKISMISDQEIRINGQDINIHDIKTIIVDSNGQIIDVILEDSKE